MYVVDGAQPGDPQWLHQIASFRQDQVLRHARWVPDLAKRVRPIQVETISPATLKRRYHADRIDALVVDAEGADWEIVSLFLELGCVPDVLFFEHKHLKHSTIAMAIEKLSELKFKMEFVGPDLLAARCR